MTDSIDEIICPYCGAKQADPLEIIDRICPGELSTTVCDECGREFKYIYGVTYDFDAFQIETERDA